MKSKSKKQNRRSPKASRRARSSKGFFTKNRSRHIKEHKQWRSKKRVAPHTLKQFFSMSRPAQDLWNLAVQVPARMRSEGASLPKAAREVGLTSNQVLRLARPAFRKLRGRYSVRASDKLLRILILPSDKGLIEIPVNDSREASLVGEYWNAVDGYLRTGDASALLKLKKRRVKSASGKNVSLLTDLKELERQASAGVLRFESLYGSTA